MVVINVVYYFGYCRNVAPPPPSSRRLCFHRRPARCAVESVLLILATGIDPIDRPQPAVFIFIGIVFNGEEKNPAKLQQQPYIEAMHVPSSRPWNSKFARHKHDHYAYKRSMKTEVSNRRRKTTRSMYTVIYSVHICTIFDSEASRSTCLYWKLLHSKRGCINAETLLWIDKNWIEEKRRALFSLRILLYLFRLNSRETRFGIVITLQRKFPYRSCTSEGTKIRSTGEAGWEQAYIKSEGDRRWFMGADALVVWHSVYRGRRWSKRWRVLATDSSKWRSLHSVYDSLFFVSRN